jgi:hypothetical protein
MPHLTCEKEQVSCSHAMRVRANRAGVRKIDWLDYVFGHISTICGRLRRVTQADELADQLQAGIAEINAELATIGDQSWFSVVTTAEGWTVGHTAHHIAEGYAQSRVWIDEAIDTGRPVVIDDAAITLRSTINAGCLEAHGAEPRAATLDMLRERGRLLVDRVRSLTDAQLDAPMMVVMGQAREGRAVAGTGTLRHARGHLESIRTALGTAAVA